MVAGREDRQYSYRVMIVLPLFIRAPVRMDKQHGQHSNAGNEA